MPEWLICILLVVMWLHGAVTAWAFAHDGKSPFWTGYVDAYTLRMMWK